MKLLSVSHDSKTVKGEKLGILTGILYMAPHTLAGGKTLCPFSTAGCRAVCLYTAGRGVFSNVQQARIRKAQAFNADPAAFVEQLKSDICDLIKKAKKLGMTPAVRLNGTTDILWEKYNVIQQFPDVQFYDYTKYPSRLRVDLPANYHLTFSYSEAPHSAQWSEEWFARGVNSAVVFSGKELPERWRGRRVLNGDASDVRFGDAPGCYVGLIAKGSARKTDNGFVQHAA